MDVYVCVCSDTDACLFIVAMATTASLSTAASRK